MRAYFGGSPFVTTPDRDRACTNKKRYTSERLAREKGHKAIRENAETMSPRLWPYPRAYCRGWHLSSHAASDTVAITGRELHEGIA